MNGKILKPDDILKMQKFFQDNDYDIPNMQVVIEVNSEEALKKINEEYYFMQNKEGEPAETDEVNVCIGNVRYKYVVENLE